MKTLRLRTENERDEYYHAVQRIIKVCADRGYKIEFGAAKAAWMEYSESMAAGWMNLGEDGEEFDGYIFANISPYLVEDEE